MIREQLDGGWPFKQESGELLTIESTNEKTKERIFFPAEGFIVSLRVLTSQDSLSETLSVGMEPTMN